MEINQKKCKFFLNDDDKFNKLKKYANLIEIWNKKMNLTGFSGDLLWKEGILESILCFDKITQNYEKDFFKNKNWLDIGSGVGFPVIPFAIMDSNINFYILESNLKRVNFLKLIKKEIYLENVEILHSRAENYEEKKFNYISARAVAHLKDLIIYYKKLATKNTICFFIKGPKIFSEIKEINLIKINYKIEKVKKIEDKNVYIVNIFNSL